MSKFTAALGSFLGWLGIAPRSTPAPGAAFSSSGPIDALINGAWGSAWINGGPVSRDEALSVAAVERGRDEICSIATLPLVNYRGLDVVANGFLDQPDPDVPRVVMLAQTLEDLLCDGISWWLKTGLDYRGFPTSARRVVNVSLTPPEGVTTQPAPLPSGVDPRGASVWVDGHEVPAALMIRFDSPGRPLLVAGARTIRRALLIDALAAMYADNPRPLETFTDTDDQTVVPFSDGEVEAFLATYKQRRKRGGPAWIPKQANRMDNSAPSPAELQLVELQRQASLELALHMGLDPEDVGVNTTSRTYFNATDRRTDKINRTLAAFLSAITDRLSMGDVTPRGQRVRWDLTEWLKPDPAAQAAYWQILEGMGVIDRAEIRAAAGFSGPPPAAPAAPALPAGAGGQNARWLPAQLGPALTAQRLAGALPVGATFSAGEQGAGFRFSVLDFAAASKPATADVEKRTITGLAVPYNAVARKYGVGFRFRPGSLEYDAANLNRLRVKQDHQTYVGVHNAVTDTKEGPVVTLKILDGPDGSPEKMRRDQLLMDAAGGLADGLSVGVDFSLNPEDGDVVWSEGEQVFDVVRATWNETSVTPDPAFTGARVTKVAASMYGGFSMECQHCHRPHPAGLACAVAAQLYPAPTAQPAVAMSAAPAAAPQTFVANGVTYAVPPAGWTGQPAAPAQPAPAQPAPQQFAQPLPAGPVAATLPAGPVSAEQLTAALTQTVNDMMAAGTVAGAPPVAQQFAQQINPGALPLPGQQAHAFGPARVTEPEPYRLTFDRRGQGIMARGSHDLSTDYHAWFSDGDKAAHDRALSFVQRKMAATFNVAVGDVDETNPTRQRPEMFVDQRSYRYPMWDAVNKGSLSDITPFAFPKFNSASGLVAAHTPGSEPSTGSYTTTGQTVTPTGYSGKARINREVWDQGGNPQVSTLIWNQMVKGVNEALEAAVVTLLNAGSYTSLATLTAGATDRAAAGATLGRELSLGLAKLQFVRGGYAFTDMFGQADLYECLTQAEDDAGRPLYPMIGATNTNGTTRSLFGAIDLGGQPIYPAWALAAEGQTAATKSYLIDRTSVHGWASPPQRLTLDQIAVAYVDLGVWGYQATAVSDDNGVRTVSWDPVA